jgi:hypothetical protein
MVKQFVFALVAVMMVAEANAVTRAGQREGRAREMEVEIARERAQRAGGTQRTQELVVARTNRLIEENLGGYLQAGQKEAILRLAAENREVATALVELIQSKRAGQHAEINEAQAMALSALAKIPNLRTKLSESRLPDNDKLSTTERATFNLVINVAKLGRTWTGKDKEVAADAIKLFAESARENGKTLEQALTEMKTQILSKHRVTIDIEAIKRWCA